MSSYLKRLPQSHYVGRAYVFWTLCVGDRRTGWLNDGFYTSFREVLLHLSWRYHIATLAYCLMPDHLHLLIHGLHRSSDQLKAVQYFRRETDRILRISQVRWQRQAYDHVLRNKELKREALTSTIHYILANPLRRGLVENGMEYPYSGSVIPGYPEVSPNDPNIWRLVEASSGWITQT